MKSVVFDFDDCDIHNANISVTISEDDWLSMFEGFDLAIQERLRSKLLQDDSTSLEDTMKLEEYKKLTKLMSLDELHQRLTMPL